MVAPARLPAKVQHFQRLLVLNEALFALSGVLGIVVMSLLAVIFFHVSGWFALVGLLPVALVIRSSVGQRNIVQAARRIELGFPLLEGRLVPAVQLAFYRADDRQGYSMELAQAAVADTWENLQPLPVERLVNWHKALLGGLILVVALALLGSAEKLAGERLREGWYWSFVPGGFPLELSVAPGHTRVDKGQTLSISIWARSQFEVKQAVVEIAPDAGRRTTDARTVRLVARD